MDKGDSDGERLVAQSGSRRPEEDSECEDGRRVVVTLGPERPTDPFATWTDGNFSLLRQGDRIVALTPCNASATDLFVWSGTDLDDLHPEAAMPRLPTRCHRYRGHIFDGGWWPCTLWADDHGRWYSFMHAEDHFSLDLGGYARGSRDLRTIALWTSDDCGKTWEYQAPAVTIDDSCIVPPVADGRWPRNAGAGDQKLVVDPSGRYLYLLYTNFAYERPVNASEGILGPSHGNLAVARSPLNANGVPGSWSKFHDGAFDEPGVGGRETWVMSELNGQWDNGQRTATWNEYLGCYVMVFIPNCDHLRIALSDDLIHWGPSQAIEAESDGSLVLYAHVVDDRPLGTDQKIGQSAWLYYTRDRLRFYRRRMTFERAKRISPATSPIEIETTENDHAPSRPWPAGVATTFDSVEDFGAVHGHRLWSYMKCAELRERHGATTAWSPLVYDNQDDVWTDHQSPSHIGPVQQSAAVGTETARVWRAPAACEVDVTCRVSHLGDDSSASAVRVLRNKDVTLPRDGSWEYLTVDRSEWTASFTTQLDRGDRLFFVLSPTQLGSPTFVEWTTTLHCRPLT